MVCPASHNPLSTLSTQQDCLTTSLVSKPRQRSDCWCDKAAQTTPPLQNSHLSGVRSFFYKQRGRTLTGWPLYCT